MSDTMMAVSNYLRAEGQRLRNSESEMGEKHGDNRTV